jgi:hypothetical protein
MSARKDNLLLAALPSQERERLDPFLKWVRMEFEETLIEPDAPITQVFFPTIQSLPRSRRWRTAALSKLV